MGRQRRTEEMAKHTGKGAAIRLKSVQELKDSLVMDK